MSTTRSEHLDGRAMALLLACCVFWGLQQILIKTTVTEVPPMWQAALRMGGATLLLLVWCAWRRIALFGRDGTLAAGLLAGLLFAGEFVCLYIGLQWTSASRLTVFLYTAPFVVALLLPRWVPAERLNRSQWLGLAIAFAAVLLAFSENLRPAGGDRQWLGDLLALGAGLFWGLTTLVIRASSMTTISAEKTLFYQLAVTTLIMPCLSSIAGETWSLSYSAYAWTSIALQTGIGAFASYLTWMWMMRIYPATRLSSFTFLTPLFALVFGVVLLGEPLTLRLLIALACVAAGLVLVNRRAPGQVKAPVNAPGTVPAPGGPALADEAAPVGRAR